MIFLVPGVLLFSVSGSTAVLAGSIGRTMAGTTGPSTGATSAYKKLVLDTNGSWTGSNPGCTGVAGTTGPSGGTTAGKFRSNFRRPVPLTKFWYWTRAEVAPEIAPVLPVSPAEVPPRWDEAGSAEPFEDR